MGQYTYGDEITLTAQPDVCCEFLYWVDKSNPCVPVSFDEVFTFTATHDVTYMPIFKKKQFIVNVTSNLPNFCCIYGNGTYDCGSNLTIRITTHKCNEISWNDAYLNTDSVLTEDGNLHILEYEINNLQDDFLNDITITLGVGNLTVNACPQDAGSTMIVTGSNTVNHNSTECICNNNCSEIINVCDYTDVVCHGNEYSGICGDELTIIALSKDGYTFNGWLNSSDCYDCQTSQNFVYQEHTVSLIINGTSHLIACFTENNNQ